MMNKNYKNRIRINKNEEFDNKEDEQCCNSPNITTNEGEIVCTNCGLVLGNDISDTELRAYTAEEIEQRKRTEIRWREFGPRTILPNTKTDSKGNLIDSKGKHLFSRLSKIQNSLVSSIERNFWEAKPKLKLLASKMNIPSYIEETAWKIYSYAAQKKLTMGRSIDGFITASLYAAIRIHESPRLLDEVCNASMSPRRVVHHSLGLIVKEVLPELGLKYRPITAEQLIFRFGTDLGLSMEAQKKAMNMLQEATKNGLMRTGKDPRGFAASAVYIAAKTTGERKTQAEVSEVAKITEVTLRSRIKDIKKKLL
jgi:transcription initiation factor TFIIB